MSDEENNEMDGAGDATGEVGDTAVVENGEGSDPGEPQPEVEQPPPPLVKSINSDDIASGLSLLARTTNGLSHAYVRLDVKGRGLTDISAAFTLIHLRFLDVSENLLTDISGVASLGGLLALEASGNQLRALTLPPMPFLQTSVFARNQISSLDGFQQPALTKLDLSDNALLDISALSLSSVPALTALNVAKNKLVSLGGLSLPHLKDLDVSGNQLKSLQGIDQLTQLCSLRAAQNKIDSLSPLSASLAHLGTLDLRGNEILAITDVAPLAALKALTTVALSDNAVAETSGYRTELLVLNRGLITIDDAAVGEEEREEANELKENRKGR